MSENTENTNKTKSETTKIDGISAQINLSPGSETHRRFAELMRESGAMTARSLVEMLMDSYQSPHTDNSEVISNLENQTVELRRKNESNEKAIMERDATIADLKDKLEEANKTANENATNGLGKQLQIDELQKKIEGAVIVKLNPVSRFFLAEMAAKTQTPPEKILEKLFIEDLQNPRSNNLPYTVSSSRIREVMEELKGANQ